MNIVYKKTNSYCKHFNKLNKSGKFVETCFQFSKNKYFENDSENLAKFWLSFLIFHGKIRTML